MSVEIHQPAPRGTTYTPAAERRALDVEPEPIPIVAPLNERLAPVGAMAAAIAAALLIGPILGLVGTGWVPAMSFVWFIALYASLIGLTEDGPAVRDRFVQILLWSVGALVISLVVLVIGYVLYLGRSVFAHVRWTDWRHNFFTSDMRVTGPLDPITSGGIAHAIVGTIEQIGIALIITVPLGIATAAFLNEVGGRYARLVRTVVEAMTALPSVVAGLFIYASVILLVTKDFNGFAAALAISVLMLPIMIRSADVVLRLVPGNLREAGLALGAGQWSVVRRVVLPTVRSGLTTAIILATAHGIGETAPVLLTSGVTNHVNFNPFSGHQVSLPLLALEFVKQPEATMKARAYATAGTLLALVLILFVTARILGGRAAGEVSDRQRKRLAAKSRRELSRIEEHHDLIAGLLDELRADVPTRPSPGEH